MDIILGSSSPRRREILGRIIDAFETTAPETDERTLPGESPRGYAERVSLDKGRAVLAALGADFRNIRLIIACDTIVTIDDRIIGKPAGPEDALAIIKTLSGRTHQVISALTLIHCNSGIEMRTESEISRITFKNLGDPELKEYLGRIEYMDKAGAYAVQESGSFIIEKIEGSLTNVIGFPLRLFFRMTREMGLIDAVLNPSAKSLCMPKSVCADKTY